MNLIDRRTVCVLTTILLFLGVGAIAYGGRSTLAAFLFAIFFAYLLDPAVSAAQQLRITKGKRGRSILLVYLGLVALLVLVGYVIGPRLVREARNLVSALPGLMEKVESGQIVHQIGSSRGWSAYTQTRLQDFLAAHQSSIIRWIGGLGSRVAEIASHIVWLVLIPILAVFFLRDGRALAEGAIQTFDRRSQRQFLEGLAEDVNEMLASYIRAQLLLAAIALVVYFAFLELLRVPYAMVLGTIGGALEFIPVVGPLVAAFMMIGVAFIAGYNHIFLLLLFLGAWRIVQDYVNSPRIMGNKLELHPLAALFAVLIGGEIGGVVGVYLSIPIMAALRILWHRYQRYSEAERARSQTEVISTRNPAA